MSDYWTEKAEEYQRKFAEEMCDHMRELVLYCERIGVAFGGCGDCGSAWLECNTCNKSVQEAHEVFDRVTGGRPEVARG